MNNPYPKTIEDESSGVKVPNEKHRIWEEGHQAGIREIVEFIENKRNALQINEEQIECRLCLSELLTKLKKGGTE